MAYLGAVTHGKTDMSDPTHEYDSMRPKNYMFDGNKTVDLPGTGRIVVDNFRVKNGAKPIAGRFDSILFDRINFKYYDEKTGSPIGLIDNNGKLFPELRNKNYSGGRRKKSKRKSRRSTRRRTRRSRR